MKNRLEGPELDGASTRILAEHKKKSLVTKTRYETDETGQTWYVEELDWKRVFKASRPVAPSHEGSKVVLGEGVD